jgi:hypothetical protein
MEAKDNVIKALVLGQPSFDKASRLRLDLRESCGAVASFKVSEPSTAVWHEGADDCNEIAGEARPCDWIIRWRYEEQWNEGERSMVLARRETDNEGVLR